MSLLPDPAALRAIATRIALHADGTRERARELDRALRTVTWHGFAASAFQSMAQPVPGALRTTAHDLDRAAHALRAHAGNVETMLDDLARAGVDIVHSGGDIVALLRHGTDPATLVLHPGALLHDEIRVGKDGVRLVKDGARLTGDTVGDLAAGAKNGARAIGSLMGI